MSKAKLKHFNDLGYSTMYFVASHYVEFKCYKMECIVDADDTVDSNCFPPEVNIFDNEYFRGPATFEGYIKWDGCSNWDFKPNDVLLHLCDVVEFEVINQVVKRLYDVTKDELGDAVDF